MSLMSVKREPEWLRESRLETKRDDFEKLNAAFNAVADNYKVMPGIKQQSQVTLNLVKYIPFITKSGLNIHL